MSGRNISYKPFDGAETRMLLDRHPDAGNVGYNDITTDAKGRIYAGSLGASPVFDDALPPRAGALWLIDLDGSARQVADDIRTAQGRDDPRAIGSSRIGVDLSRDLRSGCVAHHLIVQFPIQLSGLDPVMHRPAAHAQLLRQCRLAQPLFQIVS
ncbi:MAG: SMP-30/gluconolactonase/LRE family protein [Rhodobacteraceae bacterium]|nr:SMP-30/gluconolactonase/LRE family protein [Paracoccaceae bacterium]